MTPKRIFITGIAGFIGYHMALFFHKRGDIVAGLDNFNSYYDPLLKQARSKQLTELGISITHGNICDPVSLKQAIHEHHTTHLLHLAAQAGVRYSLENPSTYIQTNIAGFLNILEVCRDTPSLYLTYASSSSIYGLNDKVPFALDDKTDHQASLYGVTKKTNELMAQTYHHLFAIPVTGLRFFTVYGPWGRPDMAYFSFTKAIIEGRPIDVFNHGNMLRDFTYIDDIVAGTAAAVDRQSDCALYNLGNHNPEKLETLISLIEAKLGRQAIRNFLPHQSGDVVSTYAEISTSQKELSFDPKTSLKEGISHFVDWYLNYFSKK